MDQGPKSAPQKPQTIRVKLRQHSPGCKNRASEAMLHCASLLQEERATPSENVKHTLTIGYFTFYHCLHLQCHGTLRWQDVGLGTVAQAH